LKCVALLGSKIKQATRVSQHPSPLRLPLSTDVPNLKSI